MSMMHKIFGFQMSFMPVIINIDLINIYFINKSKIDLKHIYFNSNNGYLISVSRVFTEIVP